MKSNPCLNSAGSPKRHFTREADARAELHRLLALPGLTRHARERLRVYRCRRCSQFHVGKAGGPVRSLAS